MEISVPKTRDAVLPRRNRTPLRLLSSSIRHNDTTRPNDVNNKDNKKDNNEDYNSNEDDVKRSNPFYPVFHTLSDVLQVALTCERLRSRLCTITPSTSGKWAKIRNLCIDHVKLEMILMEADAVLSSAREKRNKKRFDAEATTTTAKGGGSRHGDYVNLDEVIEMIEVSSVRVDITDVDRGFFLSEDVDSSSIETESFSSKEHDFDYCDSRDDDISSTKNDSTTHTESFILIRRKDSYERNDFAASTRRSFLDCVADAAEKVASLGNEIRSRVLSRDGIDSVMDLALYDPQEMMALTEAMAVYERAADQYRLFVADGGGGGGAVSDGYGRGVNGGRWFGVMDGMNVLSTTRSSRRMQFTDLKSAGMDRFRRVLEVKLFNLYKSIYLHIIGNNSSLEGQNDAKAGNNNNIGSDNENSIDLSFTAVLMATRKIMAQISLIKNQISCTFPSHWNVDMTISAALSQLCSGEILRLVGGAQYHLSSGITSHNMCLLSLDKLLAIITWIRDYFRNSCFFGEDDDDDEWSAIDPAIVGLTNDEDESSLRRQCRRRRPDCYVSTTSSDFDTATTTTAASTTTVAGSVWSGSSRRVTRLSHDEEMMKASGRSLYHLYRSAKREVFVRIDKEMDVLLDNIYRSQIKTNHYSSATSHSSCATLCNDIFSLVTGYLDKFHMHLSRHCQEIKLSAVSSIISKLHSKQIIHRRACFTGFQSCCAAALEFMNMAETCRSVIATHPCSRGLLPKDSQDNDDDDKEGKHRYESIKMVVNDAAAASRRSFKTKVSELCTLYYKDGVYAAQMTHVSIFESVHDAIGELLFGLQWEDDLLENELAMIQVTIFDDYMSQIEEILQDQQQLEQQQQQQQQHAQFITKAIEAIVSATVVYYVKCLLIKADNHPSSSTCKKKKKRRQKAKGPYFGDTQKALDRMMDDIMILQDYFHVLASGQQHQQQSDQYETNNTTITQSTPHSSLVSFITSTPDSPLVTFIKNKFDFLKLIHEVMSIAASDVCSSSQRNLSDVILSINRTLMDVNLTKRLLLDMWHLMNPAEKETLWDFMSAMDRRMRTQVQQITTKGGEETCLNANDGNISTTEDRCKGEDEGNKDNSRHNTDNITTAATTTLTTTATGYWFQSRFQRTCVPGLSVNEMLAELYLKSRRKKGMTPRKLRQVKRVIKSCHVPRTDLCDVDKFT